MAASCNAELQPTMLMLKMNKSVPIRGFEILDRINFFILISHPHLLFDILKQQYRTGEWIQKQERYRVNPRSEKLHHEFHLINR